MPRQQPETTRAFDVYTQTDSTTDNKRCSYNRFTGSKSSAAHLLKHMAAMIECLTILSLILPASSEAPFQVDLISGSQQQSAGRIFINPVEYGLIQPADSYHFGERPVLSIKRQTIVAS